MKNLQGKQIAEYDFNYNYRETKVKHKIKEFYDDKRKINFVLLEKETRQGEIFVKLPSSLWVTCEGYPPLCTDASLQYVKGKTSTNFFAGLPTVQSEEHMRIFDEYLTEKLSPMGIDYPAVSKVFRERLKQRNIDITGFSYSKEDVLDKGIIDAFLEIACGGYEKVLESSPCECPVNQWVDMILGSQAENEYYLFKDYGFTVPFSAQKAFFTMMMDKRNLPDKQ
ncbi:MAG: hypothetical protein D6732_29320 [Methanobacteriota archaeon]|nr:MAG: hypothetical protein D6732_29320 [Euryarchaeota archaeon]